ncbi:TetR/AcrR family transcriptional regulator [Sphaerisporangium rufum]|nr:TetR/AcrR family transcriptional regulator [Sphaerisporangium rufum]
MTDEKDTRRRILATAADLFRRQGYSGTGLSQVLAAAQVPKGTLYHHFPGGKEQLGVEAVRAGGAEIRALLESLIAGAGRPGDALDGTVRLFRAALESSDYTEGCPVATVALESAGCDPLRAACDEAYRSWTDLIATALGRWEVPADRHDDLATTILATLEGALLLARVRRDTAPLDAAARQLRVLVDAAVPAGAR